MSTEFLKPEPVKWYFKTRVLVIALLIAGPFALPLLWFNPKIKTAHKIIWTIVILALTYFSGMLMERSLKSLTEYYQLLSEITKT